MTSSALLALMLSRGMNQADIARLAGVTRQAVSLWLRLPKGAIVDMKVSHLLNLSRGTGLSLDELTAPWPALGPEEEALAAELLWDRAYASLLEFALALAREDDKALARLAHAYGLYRGARIAGDAAWGRFPQYKRHLQPQRREGLERVWRFETSRA